MGEFFAAKSVLTLTDWKNEKEIHKYSFYFFLNSALALGIERLNEKSGTRVKWMAFRILYLYTFVPQEAELALARTRFLSEVSCASPSRRDEVERYRQAALHAERLLEARDASYRQQIMRLENQVSYYRKQISSRHFYKAHLYRDLGF